MTRPLRILVVDDNADDRVLARRVLTRSFPVLETFEANDAQTLAEGLALPDLDAVITDYALGFTDGIAVLEAVKQRDPLLPVIMFTITGTEEICAEGMKKGLFDYILKKPEYYARLPIAVSSALELADAKSRLVTQERELRERAVQLAEANRRKDEFLAMLAHELRNPLAPLRSGVNVLRLKGDDQRTREQVRDMMDRQVTHMARLVDDLLDVSRITRGTIDLRKERLDLAVVVNHAVDDHRHAFDAAGLELELHTPGDPVQVFGDATRLRQVLDNLLDNARKFTGSGGSVSVRLTSAQGEAELSVRDTGIGIEPRILPHLYEVFSQADNSLERTRGGLGLGLSLTKGLVELHGGRIEASSEGVGRGAEFTVGLPLVEELPALTGTTVAGARGDTGLRVLVIEDNRDAADSLRMFLELMGHEVRVAYAGDTGLSAATERPHDVIVCDIGLPVMDGYAIARALRTNPATAQTRLIALTGYGQEEHRRKAIECGFNSHLVKPVDPERLLEQLQS